MFGDESKLHTGISNVMVLWDMGYGFVYVLYNLSLVGKFIT